VTNPTEQRHDGNRRGGAGRSCPEGGGGGALPRAGDTAQSGRLGPLRTAGSV